MVVDALSTTLTALSDPTRRSILARLAAGPATVGELAGPFRVSQQAVSKHLAYLERARLVKKRREGRSHVCTLRPVPFKEVADWVEHYRRFWELSFDRLDEYLRGLNAKEHKHVRKQRRN
jgi:DNA-binding transcriptional ArsR family regulator